MSHFSEFPHHFESYCEWEEFRLIEQIRDMWWRAGIRLSIDTDTLYAYSDKAENNTQSCTLVLRNWINNAHDEYPVTWSQRNCTKC